MLILQTLQWGAQHGYAITQMIRARSSEALQVETGSLYPALHRLERAKLLVSRWSELNGRRRRVYQLTAKGQRALAKRQTEWATFAQAMNAVVGEPR